MRNSALIVWCVGLVLASARMASGGGGDGGGGGMLSVGDGAEVAGVDVRVLQHVRGRSGVSLGGPWRVIVDPYGHGWTTPWSGPRGAGDGEAFWRDPVDDPTKRVEHRFDDAHTLGVPGDWNSQRASLLYYEGDVWYERDFDLPERAGDRRWFVCFGAAANRARVWVNGVEVGSHEGGFTPFHLEVTEHVRPEGNRLTVLVNNERRPRALPAMMSDWWNYGGLTREVRLVDVGTSYVRDYWVGLAADGSLAAWVQVEPARARAEVTIRVDSLGVRRELRTDANGVARLRVERPRGMRLWSPASPTLYDVTIGHGGEWISDRIGFRTIETRGADILLNGASVFLRGVCIHEEAPRREGRAWSEADARELLGWAKDLGCNFVRLSHYPHNEHMVRVADELGLLVWSEIPVYWVVAWDDPETLRLGKTMLGETIARDRNRASCVIWSVGNETGHEAERTAFRNALADFVKAADPTRLVSAALFARLDFDDAGRLVGMHVEDPFCDAADVLAVNEYAGWYYGHVDDIPEVRLTLSRDKPFIISEFGAGAKAGLRGDASEVWTEDHAALLYAQQIAWFESGHIENFRGVAPWILRDFRSPRRLLYDVQDGYNRKGLVSETGERKLTFGQMRAYYDRVRAEWAAGSDKEDGQ